MTSRDIGINLVDTTYDAPTLTKKVPELLGAHVAGKIEEPSWLIQGRLLRGKISIGANRGDLLPRPLTGRRLSILCAITFRSHETCASDRMMKGFTGIRGGT